MMNENAPWRKPLAPLAPSPPSFLAPASLSPPRLRYSTSASLSSPRCHHLPASAAAPPLPLQHLRPTHAKGIHRRIHKALYFSNSRLISY